MDKKINIQQIIITIAFTILALFAIWWYFLGQNINLTPRDIFSKKFISLTDNLANMPSSYNSVGQASIVINKDKNKLNYDLNYGYNLEKKLYLVNLKTKLNNVDSFTGAAYINNTVLNLSYPEAFNGYLTTSIGDLSTKAENINKDDYSIFIKTMAKSFRDSLIDEYFTSSVDESGYNITILNLKDKKLVEFLTNTNKKLTTNDDFMQSIARLLDTNEETVKSEISKINLPSTYNGNLVITLKTDAFLNIIDLNIEYTHDNVIYNLHFNPDMKTTYTIKSNNQNYNGEISLIDDYNKFSYYLTINNDKNNIGEIKGETNYYQDLELPEITKEIDLNNLPKYEKQNLINRLNSNITTNYLINMYNEKIKTLNLF
jgi:hypothetical protein